MEKINVAELLKDCPIGMELDCTKYSNVYFVGIDDCKKEPKIKLKIQTFGTWCSELTLDKYGKESSHPNAKCLIFPKGKTTWEGFQRPFKGGDIVYTIGDSIAILGNRIGEHSESFRSYCGVFDYEFDTDVVVSPQRLATEEEKEELFQAIKDNGYKWNPESKTLEKLVEPKFKVGARIRNKKTLDTHTIHSISEDTYCCGLKSIWICDQDEYELVPDKFDITLKPFDKVLARDSHRQIWTADLFSHNIEESVGGYKFACIGHCWHQCIPYKDNEHLLNTTNDCKEYFKTWK